MRTVYDAVLVMVCSLSWPLASASAQTLEQRVTALEAKLACITVQGTELFITGCNVHIRNGQNATNVKNGTGNLIIGYNEGTHERLGSHNLVIGPDHLYNNTGSLVAGHGNSVSGVSASVTGGAGNTAAGPYASVSSGLSNTANGRYASVSGGEWNTADDADGKGAHSASVSGGRGNHAFGFYTSVSGGMYNKATGEAASVSGGYLNVVSGDEASVSGGLRNVASGPWATVRGGPDCTASTNYALLPASNSPCPSSSGAGTWIVGTSQVVDRSGHGCHGALVNLPATAVTGHNFDVPYDADHGTSSFHDVPTKYNAVHFHEDDMEDAGWTTSFTWRVPPTIKSGVYAARVARSGQRDALSYYVPFVVGPSPDSEAPLLFIAPTFTWLAYANMPTARGVEAEPWNDIWTKAYGNRGAYCQHADGSPNYYGSSLRPIPRIVPFASSTTSRDATDNRISLGRDLFFTYWLETYLQSHDFSVKYDVMGDEDVHAIGRNVLEQGDNGLLRYRVVVTGAHPEYWTDEMRIAVNDYVQRGGRLMYLSGNGQYWVTSVASSRPHILEVRKRVNVSQNYGEPFPGEYHHSTTGQLGGLWRDVGHAPQELCGVGYAAGDAEGWGTMDSPTPFFRLHPDIPASASFIVEGVATTDVLGAGYGVFGRSALSDEVDRYDPRLGSQPDTTVIATGQWQPESLTQNPLPEDRRDFGTCHTEVECAKSLLRAGVVYCRKGAGEVFAAGSRLWTAALMDTHAPHDFATITANVLKHFLNVPSPRR
jgi:hypothetical protein